LQVLGVFPRRTAANTLAFLDHVAAAMPFPVQRVQTDRGQEFFAYEVQDRLRDRLRDRRIKFRPNRPRAPHLNGKSRACREFRVWAGMMGARESRHAETQRAQDT